MTSVEFDIKAWTERVAQLLPLLAQVQGSYLREYQERHARVIDLRDGKPPPFPLDDLRLLYDEVHNSRLWGMEARYTPLRAVLDPVRYELLGHPVIGRVAVTGRLIGDNDFWMQILGSGGSMSTRILIAGLMARAAQLPNDGFRTALRELDAFLTPEGDVAAADTLGNLDEACDMFLFYGLILSGRIEVADGMVLLSYEEVLRFVDQNLIRDFAPSDAEFHGWRAVGAIIRPFRWRPEFRRRGSVNDPVRPPSPFFREAAAFLDLLSVSHATRIAPLAALSNRIDASAGRLFGREMQSPGFYRSWSAEGFGSFDGYPPINPAALAEAQQAFRYRDSARYEMMAPIVTRLSEALARNGPFATADRVQDVAMALERMYVADESKIGRKLRNRAARLLGTDAASENRIVDDAKELYDVRSDIVHNRLHRLTPERVHTAFVKGFDIARQSLFKLLREDPPKDWAEPRSNRSQRTATDREIGERPD